MLRHFRGSPLLLILLLIGPARAQDGPVVGDIAWSKDLTSGLAEAKATGRILMICVNAKNVEGREEEEPAAKGLREVIYRDPRVVQRSRDFVCVFMTPRSGTADYGELSILGIEGEIVSPQHIFVAPGGDRILLRREYWRHGKGDKAVDALLALMDKARGKSEEPTPPAGGDLEGGDAPEDAEARAAWIAEMLELVKTSFDKRAMALSALIEADRDGDCTNALIELLPKSKKNAELLRALIRALGRDGLETAAEPISDFLRHREETIRANAAVSLEYIGSKEKKVIAALVKAAGKEKVEEIANHVYRALGRSGAGEAKVRALLLKMSGGGKSEFATYGPCIGLAYFEGDAKAARGLEKLLKQIGVPGGRRGGGRNTVKRVVLSWALAAIGDEDSGTFVRDELMAGLKNVKAFWVEGMTRFWESVALKCEGDESQMDGIVAGVRITVSFARGGGETRILMDEARLKREDAGFTPKGDYLLAAPEQD